ncbi:MAG: hypothetical protein JKY19_01885, partial [Alcanivoracaceae bacterium]|nr:hypothetical protein [Alcanivoracaceae bacterium]
TVANLSLEDIDNVTLRLSKIATNGEHSILQTQSLNIATQSSQQFNLTTEITQANTDVRLIFEIDPENTIIEVNEDNNFHIETITKVQSLDLVITAQDITIPSQLIIGEAQNIAFTFRIVVPS